MQKKTLRTDFTGLCSVWPPANARALLFLPQPSSQISHCLKLRNAFSSYDLSVSTNKILCHLVGKGQQNPDLGFFL